MFSGQIFLAQLLYIASQIGCQTCLDSFFPVPSPTLRHRRRHFRQHAAPAQVWVDLGIYGRIAGP